MNKEQRKRRRYFGIRVIGLGDWLDVEGMKDSGRILISFLDSESQQMPHLNVQFSDFC